MFYGSIQIELKNEPKVSIKYSKFQKCQRSNKFENQWLDKLQFNFSENHVLHISQWFTNHFVCFFKKCRLYAYAYYALSYFQRHHLGKQWSYEEHMACILQRNFISMHLESVCARACVCVCTMIFIRKWFQAFKPFPKQLWCLQLSSDSTY